MKAGTWPNQGRGSEACRLASIAALRGFWSLVWPVPAVLAVWGLLAVVFR